MDKTRVEKVQDLLDQALQLLREDRDIRQNAGQVGGRELSEAITSLETAGMFMNRSLFADQPYTPKLASRVQEAANPNNPIRNVVNEPTI